MVHRGEIDIDDYLVIAGRPRSRDLAQCKRRPRFSNADLDDSLHRASPSIYLEQTRSAHAAGNAHRHHTATGAAALALHAETTPLPRAGPSERIPHQTEQSRVGNK